MKKAIGKRLLALLLVVLMLCPQTYASVANDLDGHWCRTEIETFLNKGLVQGYPDGRFRPDATVTRAEFIRMVNSAFGFVREGTKTFTDVNANDWYSGDLAAAARTGWFSGMPDGSAMPEATITRQEAAKLLVSMLGESRPGSFVMFTDGQQVADWARDYVETAGALGIIEGFPDGTFRPARSLTRAETVKMISNIARQIYASAGTYTDRVDGNAVVLCDGVSLRGVVIKGNLYVSESCAGSLDLTDTTVEGTIVILGSAKRTITLRSSTVSEILLRPDATNTKIVIENGTKVDLITVNAPTTIEVGRGGYVKEIRNNADGTKISGEGTVDLIVANEPTIVRGSTVAAGGTGKMTGSSGSGSTGGGTVPTPQPPVEEKYALTAKADKDNYNINEENRVSGQVTNNGKGLSGVQVSMLIRSVDEDVRVALDETTSAEDGSFEFTFVLPDSSKAGVYEIRITAGKPVRQSVVQRITVIGEVTVDKTELKAMIDKAESYQQDKYTSDSWTVLADELARAKSVYENASVTQAEVDAQTDALAQAIGALVLRADKTELKAVIDKAESIDRSKYTQESLKVLDDALEAAKAVYADDNATRKDVAQAAAKLQSALDALEEKGAMDAYLTLNGSTAPSAYRAIKGEAGSFPNGGDSLVWLTDGAGTGTLKVTVRSSDESVLKPNAIADGTMSAAITGALLKTGSVELTFTSTWGTASQSGKLTVTVVNEATVTALREAIEAGNALSADDYKEEGFTAFTAALASAQAALDNVSSTEAQLTDALNALNAAREALVSIYWSDITVTITERNGTEALSEYTIYQDGNDTLCINSDTDADKISEFVFEGDSEAAFHFDSNAWSTGNNHKNFTFWAENLGTYTVKITVKFTDGTYTEVTLKVTVVEKVDTTELRSAINTAKTLVESNYSEGWDAFQAALSEAQAVYSLRITTQDAVDAAAKKLNDAMAALVIKPVDTSKLELVWYQGTYSSTETVPETVHASVGDWLPSSGFYWLNVKGLEKGQVTVAGIDVRSTDDKVVTVNRSIEGASSTSPYIYRQRVDLKVVGEGTATITTTVTLVDGTVHQAPSITVTTVTDSDKAALNALIAEAEALNESDYTAASWAVFAKALSDAKSVAANTSATQTAVDEAKANLQSAMDALEKAAAADKTALNALIAKAEALDESDYTASSWKAMQTALASAKKVAADASATEEAVAAEISNLQNKLDALAGRASLSDVTARLDLIKKLDETLYTAASWEALQKTVADAQQLVDDGSSDIKAVNAAYDAITSAIYSLHWADSVEFKTFTNAPELEYNMNYIVDWASAGWMSELDQSIYRIVIGGFESADGSYTKGDEYAMLYAGMNDLTKAQLEEALLAQCETIVVATYTGYASAGGTVASRYLAYLAVNDGLDRTALHTAVATAFTLDESDYTAASWKTMQTALTQARKVYADKSSTQEQIDAAAKALQDKLDALAGRASLSNVTARLDLAKKLDETLYTAASWEVLQNAVADAQQLVDANSSDIKAVNAAYDAITSAIYSLRWADSVEFKTFTNAPELSYNMNYIVDWASAGWMSELDQSIYRIVIGGFESADGSYTKGDEYAMLYAGMNDLTKAQLEEALLAQCETIVVATYTGYASAGGTVASRYLAYLAVNDGLDRTALHAAVESTRGLAEADYTAEQWLAVQTALTQARKVYADKSSTQEQIDAAAKALSEAVSNKSGSDTPVGEIKDIGLAYDSGYVTIMNALDEYTDYFFQIKAGSFTTDVTEESYYDAYGSVAISDEMIAYIKSTGKQSNGKYVVTILLYQYDEESDTYVPYTEDGKQVELLVYLAG